MHYGRAYMPENVFVIMLIGSLIFTGVILLALYLMSRPDKKKPLQKPLDKSATQKRSPMESKTLTKNKNLAHQRLLNKGKRKRRK